MRNRFFVFLLIAICCTPIVNGQISKIIPQPHVVNQSTDKFSLNPQTQIIYDDESFKSQADYLATLLGVSDSRFEVSDKKQTNTIFLRSKRILGEQAYEIEINSENIICSASTTQGMFYAIQTLSQSSMSGVWQSVKIEDAPKYPWRGLMLDVSRHFFGVDVVKNLLDVMAHLKMNTFHFHLTDETGWRIEIKKYPKLTEIGAEGNWSDRQAPRKFYTQEEIKEIVAYAAERHIMVVPEIDMPGHATAASKAYPEISGEGEGRWDGFTFHPAKDITYQFIEDILDEVFILFPAPYIHIGGDEVHYGNQSWKTDQIIQQFIKDNNLGDEVGMEHYFVRRVCDIVNKKGRKIIGWDEMLLSGVTPEQAIIMWWRHDRLESLSAALERGFEVILTPRTPCYLDFIQDEVQQIGRRWQNSFVPLQAGYEFPTGIAPTLKGYENQVKGIQASAWTERIADTERLYYMIFPRLAGISEASWAGEDTKNYDLFLNRIKPFLKYLDSKGINYFNPFDKESTPEPWGPTKQDVIAEG